jgi:hypothetical protein
MARKAEIEAWRAARNAAWDKALADRRALIAATPWRFGMVLDTEHDSAAFRTVEIFSRRMEHLTPEQIAGALEMASSIAILADSRTIRAVHVAEALQYLAADNPPAVSASALRIP